MRLATFLSVASLLSLVVADAGSTLNGDQNNEGEDHKDLDVPSGARLVDIPVGDDGEQITVYWSDPVAEQRAQAKSAYIMIHGKLRDGNNYWEIINEALESAVKDGVSGADEKAFLVAPQFFSEEYNSGQYSKNTLAFGDTNAWQAGDIATHPKGTSLSSIDALDAIVQTFADKDTYPSITNITLVGHGGGGQLLTRYAAVGQDGPDGIYMRYVVGDASTHAYFTEQRPTMDASDGKGCDYWNTWRYGFDNFTGTAYGKKDPQEYFKRYVNRDVIILVAKDDVKEGGDQFCPALVQGGVARRDRNFAWWQYINTLARTDEPVQLFNVSDFSDIPDWSSEAPSGGKIKPRLVVIEDAEHDPATVFGSKDGRAALFEHYDIPWGWRPKNYESEKSDCTGCAGKRDDNDSGNDSQDGEGAGNDDNEDAASRIASYAAPLLAALASAAAMSI